MTVTLTSLIALCALAQADGAIVYRELVKGQPQGVAKVFDAPQLLLVRATFDQPLPNAIIGLKLIRNGKTSLLDKPFDLEGDTRQFDLRLRTPDGKPYQPGVYKFTITQGNKTLAEATFLVAQMLPPRQPRVYYGPPLAEGADPFAEGLAAAVTLLPPPPPQPLIVFRKVGPDERPEIPEQYMTTDELYARLALEQPLADPRAHLMITRDGEALSEGDIELKDLTTFEIRLMTEVGFPPGKYLLTISSGERTLGEAAFTMVAAGG